MKKEIFVTRSSMPPMEEYFEELKDLWATHWLTNMGEKHKRLQTQLCEFMGVENIELLTNGHMALELTLQALGLEGEVITSPYTFASTTHAIVRNGLTPVFCDINPVDYTIDVNKIESLITDRTCAIMPIHVYGNICDVEAIQRIADKHRLKVIYDAAHTFGETYRGAGVGTFGDASCFSFHATKVFNTIEGGAVCFKDKELGEKLYCLKNFGIQNEEIVNGVGANAKMNEFQAAMGLCNLRHISEEIEKRRCVFERYRERLSKVNGIRLNPIQKDVQSNYSYFPILVDEDNFGCSRENIYEELKKKGINTRKYFYPITNAFECYANIFDPSMTPVAMDISHHILTLPIYAELLLKDVDYICDEIMNLKK